MSRRYTGEPREERSIGASKVSSNPEERRILEQAKSPYLVEVIKSQTTLESKLGLKAIDKLKSLFLASRSKRYVLHAYNGSALF